MSFGVEIKAISDFLRMDPRPLKPFNETLGFNGRHALSFNEIGNRLQPDYLKKNLEFFSALRICGVYPIGARLAPFFSPYNRNFHVLEGVQMVSSSEPILGFSVPEMGYAPLMSTFAKNMMVKDGNYILGDSNHLLSRARASVDGDDVVCFGVEKESGTRYYMWDVDSIYPVNTNQCALFVRRKSDGKLVLVSDVSQDFCIMNVEFERVNWTNLNFDLLQEDKIVVDVDLVSYEVEKLVTVALSVENNVARDACFDVVVENVKLPDGVYEFDAKSLEFVPNFGRKTIVDSPSTVTLKQKCVVSMKELSQYVVVPRDVKGYKDFFLNFRPTMSYANCLNSCTVKIPALANVKAKPKRNKVEMIKEFYQNMASKNGGLAKVDGGQFVKLMAADHLFIKQGQVFNLKYVPKIRVESHGFANYAIPGYGVVAYSDMPIKNKNLFFYKEFYLLFYDPTKWKFRGEDRVEDYIDLNE
jgi:hypothetical protein